MNCVSWDDANAFCAYRGARLPSEAEWEYAARGTKLAGAYPWGGTRPGARLVNACDLECARWSKRNEAGLDTLDKSADRFATTAPVGSFPGGCSTLGVCGLADNVREWTSDPFGRYGSTPKAETKERTVRGGGWTSSEARELRRTHRSGIVASARRHDLGFRCAKSL
jgi:formylglycine-generating enzyme required for sulfatase activity